MKHILTAKQFSRNDLEYLISEARKMDQVVDKWGSRVYDEKIMATLFYEPSTRTRLSFESAMLRLGGRVISETDIQFSSQSKWEILEDTIRIISGYADIIVIRSKTQWDALRASLVSSVPIINAWDGAWEHPSQSLLDLYTISKNFPGLLKDEKLNITFVGDLRYGRTVHSLSILLRNFPNISITFIAPESLNLPEEYRKEEDIFSENSINLYSKKPMFSIWHEFRRSGFRLLKAMKQFRKHLSSKKNKYWAWRKRLSSCIHFHESMKSLSKSIHSHRLTISNRQKMDSRWEWH